MSSEGEVRGVGATRRPRPTLHSPIGPTAIAGWIAHVAFWTLLIVGAWSEGLAPKAAFIFLGLTGLFGLPARGCSHLYVAVLDVVLVSIVLKSNVWLT
jgi:hypothetical protein